MIVLKAEATVAVAEALADNVTSSIFAPPLWVTTRHRFGLCPTHALSFPVKVSWSLLITVVTVAATGTIR